MKNMILRTCGLLFVIILIASSCGSTKEAVTISDEEKIAFKQQEGDTLKIKSDETEYEIIIIELGFNFWLQSIQNLRVTIHSPTWKTETTYMFLNGTGA